MLTKHNNLDPIFSNRFFKKYPKNNVCPKGCRDKKNKRNSP